MSLIRIGVLGAGRGLSHARAFHDLPESCTVAVCDRRRPRLEAGLARAELDGVTLYTEYEAFLRHEMDAVVVASGGPSHAEHACTALEAGKHVLSELPMDYTLEGCRRVVAAVQRTGLHYMLGENVQFFPYMLTLKRWIEAGRLGHVTYAESDYVHDSRGGFYQDEAGKRFSREEARGRTDVERSWWAGIHPINDLTHCLGPLLWLLDDYPETVTGFSTGAVTAPEEGNPDAEVALITTRANRIFRILCAFASPHPYHLWFHLLGTRGAFEAARGAGDKAALYVEGEGAAERWVALAPDQIDAPLPEAAKRSGHGGSDWFVARTFLDVLLGRQPNPVDVYRAADYTLPGIVAVASIAQGGQRMRVPDLRLGGVD